MVRNVVSGPELVMRTAMKRSDVFVTRACSSFPSAQTKCLIPGQQDTSCFIALFSGPVLCTAMKRSDGFVVRAWPKLPLAGGWMSE